MNGGDGAAPPPRRGRDRLRDRRDPEDYVATHRLFSTDRLHSDRIDMDLVAATDECNDTGNIAAPRETASGFSGPPAIGVVRSPAQTCRRIVPRGGRRLMARGLLLRGCRG